MGVGMKLLTKSEYRKRVRDYYKALDNENRNVLRLWHEDRTAESESHLRIKDRSESKNL